MADRRSRICGDRGAAAVEMAMTAIFLFLLIAGIFDLGRALYTLVGMNEAAQEGAIYGSFQPTPATDIRERVKDSITFPELEDEDVIITCPNGIGGDLVEVTVTHDLDLVAPIISQWFGGEFNLSRTFTGEVFLGGCEPLP